MADDDKEKSIRWLHDVIPPDWDKRPISLVHEIMRFLENVKDEGTSIDSGTDGESGDLWVKIQGVEYWINIRKSNNQLVKEGKLPPPAHEGDGEKNDEA